MKAVIKHLIRESNSDREGNSFTILGELSGNLEGAFDQLICFVPGMLALGAHGETAASHLNLAKSLLETCLFLYRDQPTGLAPERVYFKINETLSQKRKILQEAGRFEKDPLPPSARAEYYMTEKKFPLRPETLESLFYLYRFTRDEKYREWGWEIWEAFETYLKVSVSKKTNWVMD
jgi:mannosyl-oligosaccharide alpha-1,2-mannosidase